MSVTGDPLWMHSAFLQRFEQCAARFAVVLAVAEAAMADQFAELDKARFNIIPAYVHQTKFANTGGVDQLAAAGEVEQTRCGGGVGAFAG
jgi:hypothetical protein